MPPDSRQRILAHLKQYGKASVSELSRALGLTPVTIRHHLEILQQEGLVAPPTPHRRGGPGRPEKIYMATDLAGDLLPRSYDKLCLSLLQTLRATLDPEGLKQVLQDSGRRLATTRLENPCLKKLPPAQRAHHILQDLGYLPAWTREKEGPRLALTHCPYVEAALLEPAVCQFDQSLLDQLFGVRVEPISRMAEGAQACLFAIDIPLSATTKLPFSDTL